MRFLHFKRIAVLNSHLIDYPTPIINYTNSFGSIAGICLGIQIITGILLVMHYTPHIDYAFASIEHIMRNVNNGWLIRYIHSNGASLFFFIIYLHLFKNKNDSESSKMMWLSGSLIFILVMATSFLGYILPWGQMSFWGATVITNLFSIIPYIGPDIAQWLWGGFSVANPTLNRFFSLHYLLPFIISGLVLIHLTILHLNSSTDDDECEEDIISFYPYYYFKDLFFIIFIICVFIIIIFFFPNMLGHPDNYIVATINVTPAHLVPEWYFLPFYAALRSTPDKLGGFVFMIFSIISLFMYNNCIYRVYSTSLINEHWIYADIIEWLIIGWLGSQDLEEPYSDISTYLSLLSIIDFIDK